MNNDKYNELRNRIEKKNFEGKNESLSKWLYYISFFGNAGSIFFATFFIYPILLLSITTNLGGGSISTLISIILSICILIIFELLKRKTIANLSFDIIKEKKISFLKNIGLLFSVVTLVGFSFYFSLNGAAEFVKTNDEFIKEIDLVNTNQIDSIKFKIDHKIYELESYNKELITVNNNLRNKIIETPLNYKSIRDNYQNIINNNQIIINGNDEKIINLEKKKASEINNIVMIGDSLIEKNKNRDFRNILLFILISTFIELVIIIGVTFKEYYDLFLYRSNEEKLEPLFLKRKRYLTLIEFIYKGGSLKPTEVVMGVSKLKELIQEHTTIENPNKFTKTFINDMMDLEILGLRGNKRYLKQTYENAISLIKKMNNSIEILKNMK